MQSLNQIMEESTSPTGSGNGPQSVHNSPSFGPQGARAQLQAFSADNAIDGWQTISEVSADGDWSRMDANKMSEGAGTFSGKAQDSHHNYAPLLSHSTAQTAQAIVSLSNPLDDENADEQISPTAFFHVNYPPGSCADADAVCFCGDGCTCVGCIIHSRQADTPFAQSISATEESVDQILNSIGPIEPLPETPASNGNIVSQNHLAQQTLLRKANY